MKYPVICVWCRAKGIHKVVRMSDYPDQDEICPECSEEMRRECGLDEPPPPIPDKVLAEEFLWEGSD